MDEGIEEKLSGVMVSLTGRMNNATTLLFQCSINGHVENQMRGFFSYRETLVIYAA